MQSLKAEFDVQIDALIEVFTHSQPDEISPIIQTIKEVSLRFDMSEILMLIEDVELDLNDEKMPSAELLQQIINRLTVNSHQAKRLIDKYQQQLKTG